MYYEYHYKNDEGEDCIFNSNEQYLSEITGEGYYDRCPCCGSDTNYGYVTYPVSYCMIRPDGFIANDLETGEPVVVMYDELEHS
jgi:hypothetical protein